MNKNFNYIKDANILEMHKFLVVAVFLPMMAQAQLKSVTLSAGADYPLIPSVSNNQNLLMPVNEATGFSHRPLPIETKNSFKGNVGFNAGARVDWTLSKLFFLSAGLQIRYLRYKQIVTVTNASTGLQIPDARTVEGVPIGTFFGSIKPSGSTIVVGKKDDDIGKTNMTMLQLPLTVGTTVAKDRIRIGIGPVLSYLHYITQKSSRVLTTAGSTQIITYQDSSKKNYEEYHIGATLQGSYFITEHFGLELSAQQFLTPIYKTSDKPKLATFSLGASYTL